MARWFARLLIAITTGGVKGILVAALLIEAVELGWFAAYGTWSHRFDSEDWGAAAEFVWYVVVLGATFGGGHFITRRRGSPPPRGLVGRALRTVVLFLSVALGLAGAFAAATAAGRDAVGGLCSGKPLYEGRTATYWVERVNSSADRRIYAISALEAIGPAAADEPQAVPALVKVLEGDDEIARYAALGALNKLGPRAEDAVPVLVATLDTSSRHRDEREWAAGVLVSIGPKGERALLDVLARNPTASKTLVVLRVLGREAPDTREQWLCKPEVVAAVIELTTSVSDFDRGDVVLVLSKFGRAALPVLQTALTHSEAIVRQMATYTLGEIGPEATPTEPALARLVEQDQSQEVRNAAATALGKIRRGGNVETDPALPGRAANEARPDKEQLNAVAEFQQRTPRALGVAVVLLFSVGLVYGLVWLTSRSSCRRSAG